MHLWCCFFIFFVETSTFEFYCCSCQDCKIVKFIVSQKSESCQCLVEIYCLQKSESCQAGCAKNQYICSYKTDENGDYDNGVDIVNLLIIMMMTMSMMEIHNVVNLSDHLNQMVSAGRTFSVFSVSPNKSDPSSLVSDSENLLSSSSIFWILL